MSQKTFKCQVCPLGCSLEVSDINKELIVEGNNCYRGIEYAKSVYKSSPQVLFGRCLLLNA
ncbi:MAG: molybdopterin oxidoreductase, partial [Tissierellia bacterium]|nr:molybdopterin oxidoreductase [Tissierellia bacterium]